MLGAVESAFYEPAWKIFYEEPPVKPRTPRTPFPLVVSLCCPIFQVYEERDTEREREMEKGMDYGL